MKNRALPLLVPVIFLAFSFKGKSQANVQDSLALVELYNQTDGPHWTNNTSWLNGPVNTWYHVGLNSNGRVTTLNLYNNQLKGTIPASLGSLDSLTSLNFYFDSLTGIIPASLGNLSVLQTLDLSYNQLEDTIPSSLGNLQQLVTLTLSFNKLSGVIPASFANLHNLIDLSLFKNQLKGEIPSQLGQLAGLSHLYLSSNQFTGNIPEELGGLVNLKLLDVGYNQLTGSIPSKLGDAINLNYLMLSNNKITGNIPASVGKLTNLIWLDFSGNQLDGTLPLTLQNLIRLQVLFFNNNSLQGAIPGYFGNFSQLYGLRLNNNQFNGALPASMDNYTKLTNLTLDNNSFTFSGMETIATLYTFAVYAPQHTISIHKRDAQTLFVSAGGTPENNTYSWYKNGELLGTVTEDSTLAINSLGHYSVLVNNSVASKLTLYSDTLEIATLPVTLISFTATALKQSIKLNWKTAEEINTDRYSVERSINGLDFVSIGTVKASGTFTEQQAYSFVDNAGGNSFTGALLYRIKIIDKNGYYSYSKTISLQNTNEENVSLIYPNPAKTTAFVQFKALIAEHYTINLVDVNGKILQHINLAGTSGTNRVAISVNNLPKATYFVKITGEHLNKIFAMVKE